MLVSYAVLIGCLGGKPKNASEIARYTGIPRVTAQRKLDDLEKTGGLVRKGNRYHSMPMGMADDDYIDKCLALIRRAAKSAG